MVEGPPVGKVFQLVPKNPAVVPLAPEESIRRIAEEFLHDIVTQKNKFRCFVIVGIDQLENGRWQVVRYLAGSPSILEEIGMLELGKDAALRGAKEEE